MKAAVAFFVLITVTLTLGQERSILAQRHAVGS
jgi:hypothetical protein